MHRRLLVACALALAVFACAAPGALAGTPANVTVRIEGQGDTLLPTTGVTTSTAPVPGSGASGTSAAGAIELATSGRWDRQCFTQQLMGETHDFSHNDYWAFWINNRFSSDMGICDYQLGEGDQVLMLVDVADPSFNPTVTPLALRDVPAHADAGVPFTVTVVHYAFDGTASPVADATVIGDGVSATSGPDGKATVTAPAAGTVSLKADKAGYARSASSAVCVSNGNDGTCGTIAGTPGSASGGGAGAAEYVAPHASLAGLSTGKRFSVRRAPRTLRGHVDVGSSPLAAVKLRLLRRARGDCAYFSGRDARWHRTRHCGRGYFFRAGDSPDFSYLLPQRLGRGRYTLDAAAIDADHVNQVTRVTFRVG